MQVKSKGIEKFHLLPFWSKVAFMVSIMGLLGSLMLMFNAGRDTPVLLLILFFGWILTPFVALWFGYIFFKPWSATAHVLLNILAWFLTIASLTCYSGALDYPGMKPAFMFVLVPVVSFLLTVIVVLIAKRLSRKLR